MLQLFFFMFCIRCFMKQDVNVAVGIFHPRIGCHNHVYIFFTLQAWIFDVATDIYQYCDCMSDEKILIAPPDARVEKIKFVCW